MALGEFQAVKMRTELKKARGALIINDCYNANPASMIAAINMLDSAKNKRKIAVVGDMLELGEYAGFYHQQVGSALKKSNIDVVICAGELSRQRDKILQDSDKQSYFTETTEEASAILSEIIQENDAVLIKASRGMRFERIYNNLCKPKSSKHKATG